LERDLLSNRARFIALIIAKKLHINNRKKADVVKDLIRFKFQKFGDDKPPRSGFEYLLIMQIASLTKERKEELERLAREKAKELEVVKRTPERAMWTTDLDNLEAGIHRIYAEKEADDAKKGKTKKGSKNKKRRASKDEEGEGKEGEGAEEDTAAIDPSDNPVFDMTRWTMGSLKGPHDDSGSKRRRTK
jgi:DNA topoisomerase-2